MSGDGPLAGRRVAVTRPEAGELGERLAGLGALVVPVPLIEIADPADGGRALRQAHGRLAAVDWLAVTSANCGSTTTSTLDPGAAAAARCPRIRGAVEFQTINNR